MLLCAHKADTKVWEHVLSYTFSQVASYRFHQLLHHKIRGIWKSNV